MIEAEKVHITRLLRIKVALPEIAMALGYELDELCDEIRADPQLSDAFDKAGWRVR